MTDPRRGALLLLLAAAALGGAERLSPGEWSSRLEAIDHALSQGRGGEARSLADRLGQESVAWPGGVGSADPGLAAILRSGDPGRARRLIATLRSEFPASAGAPMPADSRRLETLDAARRSRTLAEGGEVAHWSVDTPQIPFLDRLRSQIADWTEELIDWLRRLFSGGRDAGQGQGGAIVAWIIAGMAVSLLAVVAVIALRRNRTPPASLPAAGSGGADEALAMAADAWQAEGSRRLAGGDARGAVQAWYLGLLAAAWERGLLHHRTGWTNWDYARSLPAGWEGRAGYADLTGRFDRVWYGGHDDPEGAQSFGRQAAEIVAQMRSAEAR